MSLSTPVNNIKRRIMLSLDKLPPEGLQEVVNFLEYVRFKFPKKSATTTPYRPIVFGGLWKNENIDDKDIDEVRREMWQSLGDRKL
jgi:hypothetical protein